MRQIGTLESQNDAERFAAYLVTTGVAAHAEEDGDDWAIWVRDENHVPEAKESLETFQTNPTDERYQGVERQAQEKIRAEREEREKATKNVVTMRGRWKSAGGGGVPRKRPLVITMIVMSIIVYITSGMGGDRSGPVLSTLLFLDRANIDLAWSPNSIADRTIDIRQGEVWRVITPIFVHYSTMHIAFNMIMFYQLGSVVEDRRGTAWFGGFVLLVAAISNTAGSIAPLEWGGSPFGAGMSGVLYGIFGFMWMKTLFEPASGIFLTRGTIMVLLGWMLLGMSGVLANFGLNVDNWAHGVGFAVGVIVGYLPVAFKSPGS